tara:strand:+ start:1170 stop:1343 length:174 start_codon:yes stop_codon:yes gene_type:complete
MVSREKEDLLALSTKMDPPRLSVESMLKEQKRLSIEIFGIKPTPLSTLKAKTQLILP